MRLMMLIKSDEQWEAGVIPREKLVSEMVSHHWELVKAGALLARG